MQFYFRLQLWTLSWLLPVLSTRESSSEAQTAQRLPSLSPNFIMKIYSINGFCLREEYKCKIYVFLDGTPEVVRRKGAIFGVVIRAIASAVLGYWASGQSQRWGSESVNAKMEAQKLGGACTPLQQPDIHASVIWCGRRLNGSCDESCLFIRRWVWASMPVFNNLPRLKSINWWNTVHYELSSAFEAILKISASASTNQEWSRYMIRCCMGSVDYIN